MIYQVFYYDADGNKILERVTSSETVRNLTIKLLEKRGKKAGFFSSFDGKIFTNRQEY